MGGGGGGLLAKGTWVGVGNGDRGRVWALSVET